MVLRTLKLAGTALIAAALLAPVASAQTSYGAPPAYDGQAYAYGYGAGPARDRDGYPRAGSGRDGYARDGYYEDPPPPRRAAYRERRAERCDSGSVGTILGAIAGGLLGNAATSRHGNHAAGTLAGAGAGALIGHTADRDCD
jgi:hypothetical protein